MCAWTIAQDVLKLKANLLPQPLKCLDYREESLHPPKKHFFKVLNTRENNEDKWTNIAEKGDAQGEWTYSSGELGGTPTTWHTLGVCTGQSCQWRKREHNGHMGPERWTELWETSKYKILERRLLLRQKPRDILVSLKARGTKLEVCPQTLNSRLVTQLSPL